MKYNQIKVEAGRGWPVCPIDKPEEIDYYLRHSDGLNRGDYINQQRKDFETWLSTQPEMHTAAPDRVYNVDEFEPVVWQFYSNPKSKWVTTNPENCSYAKTYAEYEHYWSNGNITTETRQWLELKPAGQKPTTSKNGVVQHNPLSDEQPDKVGEEKPSDEYLKSLPFHDKYFSNETWHPDENDIADMGKDCYDEAMAEWQVLENNVLFDGFRVHFESCDCGDCYGCSHGSYPYDLVHQFVDTDMCWEDDGFYIESPTGLIRFDKTADITMYHFVKACELLNLKLTYNPNHTQQ